jgi:hypothetical protein
VAPRALREAREAAERFATARTVPSLDPTLRTQLADLSTHLPALWESGRLTPAHKKELLRSLIRRVVLSRPQLDTIEAKVVWVSGAMTLLTVRTPVPHTDDLGDYDRLATRVVALVREGYRDGEIARRLTAEGFRSAHTGVVPTTLVTRLRRQFGEISVTTRFRRQDQVDGQWTVCGLSRALDVDRDWLYVRIRAGLLPAQRHPVTGYYLIQSDPELFTQLAAQRPKGH